MTENTEVSMPNATAMLRVLGETPDVHDALGLVEWLDLAIIRNIHPLCVMFAKQHAVHLQKATTHDLGTMTLRQLTHLSDDLHQYDVQEKNALNDVERCRSDDIKALAQSRLGEAGGHAFSILHELLRQQVMPSVRSLLNGYSQTMDDGLVDSLLTYNESLAILEGGDYAALAGPDALAEAEVAVQKVQAFIQHLPRYTMNALTRMPSHPVVVQRGDQTSPAKLNSYGKQVVERCLYGIFLLPANHRFDALRLLVDLGGTMKSMIAFKPYTGQRYVLTNVALTLVLSLLDNKSQPEHLALFQQMLEYVSKDARANNVM